MGKEKSERKEFLHEQLEWTKVQIDILDQMDIKLHEMKKIAEYAAHNELTPSEKSYSEMQINILSKEYEELLKFYQPVVH